MEENSDKEGLTTEGKIIVDKYVDYQRKPSQDEFRKWNKEMQEYYRVKWEVKWNGENQEVEDVYEEVNGVAKNMAEDVINGLANDLLT